VNTLASPNISTCARGKVAFREKALPVRRLQSRQWQIETRTGSPPHRASIAPHMHVAIRMTAN
jgi:hypothetical protein